MPASSRPLPVFPLLLLATGALLLSSCRPPSVELSTEQQDAIATVTVRDEIGMPEKAFYSGPASGLGAALGGIIGALIAESGDDDEEALITKLAETEDVGLEAIVREEINRSFVESNPVGTVVDADGDAEFQFKVAAYGLVKSGWGILDVAPIVSIEGKLVKRDGTTVWAKTAAQKPWDDVPAKSFNKWMNNIGALREGFRNATKVSMAKLIADLQSR